jgi:hypothetical protein
MVKDISSLRIYGLFLFHKNELARVGGGGDSDVLVLATV